MISTFCTLLLLLFFRAEAVERVAVLEVLGDFDDVLMTKLAEEVRAGALDVLPPDAYIVMTRESMFELLGDAALELSCVEGACEVEIGRNIGANYVVSGELLRISETYMLNLNVHNTANGALLVATDARGKDELQLIDDVRVVARRLIGQGLQLEDSTKHAARVTGSDDMRNVSARLAEKRCREEADQLGREKRKQIVDVAKRGALVETAKSWKQMSAEVSRCTESESLDRVQCGVALSNWIDEVEKLEVVVPEGALAIQTSCGVRDEVFEKVGVTVSPPELEEATRWLKRFETGKEEGVSIIILQADRLAYGDNSSPLDDVRARQHYTKACHQGSAIGCAEQAYALRIGSGGKRDEEQAKKLVNAEALAIIQQRCVEGNARACGRLGKLYYRGVGLQPSAERAARLFRVACQGGESDACSRFGSLLAAGSGIEKDAGEAYRYFDKACAMGSARGCMHQGLSLMKGVDTKQDVRRGLQLVEASCQRGLAIACVSLARAQLKSGNDELMSQGQVNMDMGCQRGSAIGCALLAVSFGKNGTGSLSEKETVALYERACVGGVGWACVNVAVMHDVGDGVPRDPPKAKAFFRRGCELGEKKACE
jgi:TPR repeat protein